MSIRFFLACLVFVALPFAAHATVYTGNPNIDFHVDRPMQHDLVSGDVTLDHVRVSYCGGGHTDYAVNDVVDPVAGYSLTINGGDLCSVTFAWSTSMYLDGSNFTVGYDATSTTVQVGANMSASLSPYRVVSGNPSGGAPVLFVTIH
jgi:hypothetical protein